MLWGEQKTDLTENQMSAALAQKIADPESSATSASAQIIDFERPDSATDKAKNGAVGSQDIVAEAKLGVEQLMRMSPDELKALITQRVKMLETELTEREARRAAIEDAMGAQNVLNAKRRRARRIRSKVNMGTSIVAAMFTGMMIVSMF